MQAQELRRLILSDDYDFWHSCANCCTMMKAVLVALKEFDCKQSCMGNIHIIIKALNHQVAALHNALLNIPTHLVNPLEIVLRK